LEAALAVTTTADLWMKQGLVNVYGINAHFIHVHEPDANGVSKWEKMVKVLGLVKVNSQKAKDMEPQIKELLAYHKLLKKMYVQLTDGGKNLHKLNEAVTQISCCEAIGLDNPMKGDCLCHGLNDTMRHSTSALVEKPKPKQKLLYPELVELKLVSSTATKTAFMKVTKFSKKSDVGKAELRHYQAYHKLKPRNLISIVPTRFVSLNLSFGRSIEMKQAINSLFSESKKIQPKYRRYQPSPL
jgi:hypothetical protein